MSTIIFIDSGQRIGSSASFRAPLADLDGDGDLDTFFGNDFGQANQVWFNDGSGNFSDSGQRLGSGNTIGVALGDLDGDGDIDAFVANDSSNDEIWLNNGSGTFSRHQSFSNTLSKAVELGDLDGDGDLDAFVGAGSSCCGGQTDSVWLNDGSGTFSRSQTLPRAQTVDLALGDLDGDGDLDVVTASSPNEGNQVLLNDGSGNFTSVLSLGNSETRGVALGDLDGDGDLDAFFANTSNQPDQVWFNDGTGNFTNSGQNLGNFSSFQVELGDFDDDSDLDALVVDNARGEIGHLWINNGSGIFTLSDQSFGTSTASFRFGVSVGDLDGDSDIDAFLTNSFPQNAPNQVWLNEPLNQPPIAEDDFFTTDEDTLLADINLLGNDSDPDGDSLSITDIDTTGIQGTLTDNGDGTFDYDPNSQFEDLNAGESATETFSYTVFDGSDTDTATITITIEGVTDNSPPVAVEDNATTAQNTAVDIPVLANDNDPDFDSLVIDSFTSGENGTVTQSGDLLTYIPNAGFSGTASFEYTVSDGTDTDTGLVTVEVGIVDNGTNKKDTLTGSAGDDVLSSGNGGDELYGLAGDDSLGGDNGPDLLNGGPGNDVLTGGNGPDIFVLAEGEGTDTITDFSSPDSIGLSGGIGFSDLSFLGEDIILTSTSEVLATLTGVDATTLDSSDLTTV